MDLRSFVENTLTQILAGVSAAQEKPTGGGRINPSDGMDRAEDASNGMRDVEFDVALTVEEKKDRSGGAEAGGNIQVASFKMDFRRGTGSNTTTVSRVKFAVPIMFRRTPP